MLSKSAKIYLHVAAASNIYLLSLLIDDNNELFREK